jgi:pilus assembly protein CpaF
MLNALAGSIPGSERVISCEEVFEIKLPIPELTRTLSTHSPR